MLNVFIYLALNRCEANHLAYNKLMLVAVVIHYGNTLLVHAHNLAVYLFLVDGAVGNDKAKGARLEIFCCHFSPPFSSARSSSNLSKNDSSPSSPDKSQSIL